MQKLSTRGHLRHCWSTAINNYNNISFRITVHRTVHQDSRTPKIIGRSRCHEYKLAPPSLMGQWFEKLKTKKNLNHDNKLLCTQQVYWVLYVVVYTCTQVVLLKQAIPGTLSEENRLIVLFIPRRDLIQKKGILGWKVCGVMNDASISWC